MNDLFETRVRAAAVAGWWIVLIGVGFIVLQWLCFLAVLHTRPVWLLAIWGPDADWAFVRIIWFWAIAILKFILWLTVFFVLWLTLWARQLQRQADGHQ
jgi:hypothetical protein